MNSLTPDRKNITQDQADEHNSGFKGGAWFIVIFVITSIGIGIWIDACTYNPLKEQKQTTDTTQLKPIKDTLTLSEYIHEKNLDSVIKTLPIGTTELVFDEKEDLTRAIDADTNLMTTKTIIDNTLFSEKLPLEKPEL